jgi:hypothetical protein
MGTLTPSFVVDLESRMQSITESEYSRLTAKLWWRDLVTVKQSLTRKELFTWFLTTAMIRDTQKGGQISFDDLVAIYTEIENKNSAAGLNLKRAQMEDLYNGIAGGEAMDAAAKWSLDIGAYMAYWPQKQAAHFLRNAHNLGTAGGYTAYDALAFFSASHPVNPFNAAAGTYANIFTGVASGDYPGACPIDDSVSLDVALVNIAKVFAYISGLKMPNGEDPRGLRARSLHVPPRMMARASQLTNAKLVAQVAASGAGSADVEAYIKSLGLAQPVQVDELAGFESNTTYFVGAEQIQSTQLGGIIFVEREAYRINFYGVLEAAELNRKDELEWHCKGRNVTAAGHPYLIFKGKGS